MTTRKFRSKEDLDGRLCADIISALRSAIWENGTARILFSGGSTPKGLLEKLAETPFNWGNVRVGLVDDRMVPDDHPASNANMIRSLLIEKIPIDPPKFYPLVEHQDPADNIEVAMSSLIDMGVPDVVILGMGNDGHFASLFPGDSASKEGLDRKNTTPLIYTTAPVDPKSRISHSWSYLRRARNHFLHINGFEKLAIVDNRLNRKSPLPIDTVLQDDSVNPILYWSP